MRDQTRINDQMLSTQAKICFPFERVLYQNELWEKSRDILDFGCGNASYASLLADKFPSKNFYCFDTNAEILNRVKDRYKEIKNIHFIDEEDLQNLESIDFLLSRFVIHHLKDRAVFYRLLNPEKRSKPKGVLVIDADDEFFLIKGGLETFLKALNHLRTKDNQDRNTRDKVVIEMAESEYTLLQSHRIIVNSDFPMLKEAFSIYMLLTAELVAEDAIFGNILDEVLTWSVNDESYAQFGMFGSIFSC
jgi:trans-aconitate methyltransferase